MAELTHLDEKLAQVLGLAQAAQAATKKVATVARQEKDTELLELLRGMGDEASKVDNAATRQSTRATASEPRSRKKRARPKPKFPQHGRSR
jgi:hypothetical protein